MIRINRSVLDLALILAVTVAGCIFVPAPLYADSATRIKEASIVTQVLYCGETITAVRLEYTDEIDATSVTYLLPMTVDDPNFPKYHVYTDRPIANVHVNDTGKQEDVSRHGRYVFIDLGAESKDQTACSNSQVTFISDTNRPRLRPLTVAQTSPVTTQAGKSVPAAFVVATR